jgi:hypothetical protein
MPNSAAVPTAVMPGNDSENSIPDMVHDLGIDDAKDNHGPKNSDAPEGSGSKESLMPKVFPVYAFV